MVGVCQWEAVPGRMLCQGSRVKRYWAYRERGERNESPHPRPKNTGELTPHDT